MQIDTSSPFGARAAARLAGETIGWLTTTGKDGTPHPKPVWFLHLDGDILIYSRPNTAKLRHITRTPRVSLNLDSDGGGGDIIVLTGAARIDDSAPISSELPAYQEKYRNHIARIGMTPESFAAAYSVAIRITPEKLSGH